MREQNIQNLKTEKLGITILKGLLGEFYVPNKSQLKKLYEIIDFDYKKYSRSVDGILLNVNSIEEIKAKEDFILLEIKTTSSKSVTELPFGVFFGFTENEEKLFKSIDNFRLCIVHTKLNQFYLLDYKEYNSMIQNKRIQYQINFKSKSK